MSNFVKRTILVLLALSFITSVTVFTLSHQGISRAHAAPSIGVPLSVYFGSDNDAFYALDAPHGYLRWGYQYQPGGNTWSPAATIVGKVFFEVANSTSTAVQALSTSDGSVRWSFTFPAQTFGKAGIAVINNIIYFTVDSSNGAGSIYALNTKDGSVAWTYTASSVDQSFGNPMVVNGVLYATEKSSITGNTPQLYALNATDGTFIWAKGIPGAATTNLASANGAIYFGGSGGFLYGVSTTDGSLIWSSRQDGGPVSTPIVVKTTVYYASANYYVTALNTNDGSLLWHYLVGKPFAPTVSPAFYQGSIYIGSMNQNLYDLQATTGSLIWQVKVGVAITTTAAIKNGIIHAGLQRGSLRTFNTSNGVERWYYHTNGIISTSSPPLEG